jgi:hypothetical protein
VNTKKNCTFNRDTGLALVKSFYASGQKPKIFCDSNNIAYHVLQYWKQIYKNDIQHHKDGNFLPVKLIDNKNTIIKVIVNGNIKIEVEQDSDLHLFKQVVNVCRSCG